MANSLYLYQERRFVRPDLGQNCLQMFSAHDTRREQVKTFSIRPVSNLGVAW